MSTTKELLITLNDLRVKNGKKELANWKQSKAKLDETIIIEQEENEAKSRPGIIHEMILTGSEGQPIDPETGSDIEPISDENPASSDLTSDEDKPEQVIEKAPRGAIGALVIELLVTEMPYADIVKIVRETYPSAKTTARSIASVAMDLRRDGIHVPSRRKAAKPKTTVTKDASQKRKMTKVKGETQDKTPVLSQEMIETKREAIRKNIAKAKEKAGPLNLEFIDAKMKDHAKT